MPLSTQHPPSAAAGPNQNTFGIVTLTHNSELYNRMDEIKRRHYAGLPHVFIYNEPQDRPKQPTDVIYISKGEHPSGIPMMIEKFVYFVRTLMNREPWVNCTHIVRANSSTFLNLPLLQEHIAKLPTTKCYAGSVPPWGKFVSGTCIVFSRDTATALSRIYRLFALLRIRREDDIVISFAMRINRTPRIDIPMVFLDRDVIPSDAELESLLRNYPLIRIRNNANRERIDVGIWEALDRLSQGMHAK